MGVYLFAVSLSNEPSVIYDEESLWVSKEPLLGEVVAKITETRARLGT